ncbi:LPS-assembly protein LptD [Rhodobacter ferrooxidans]|uniref:LPS-assembly protein LptD n=1 Tax=Rhodobacter ferrooxidans TaxID=371731 RepID=C8S3V7_9RHOB|nr:LPS assembly protein LptD [Rhodobacter sp. SW2]EEW24326.1 Organic solvent tolerance protein [Rhodobacter sp. SW2]
MRGLRLLALTVALWLGLLVPPAAAQDMATLIANRVSVVGDDTLVAEGAVEVLYQGRRLRAARITYDRPADRLHIEGPITLIDGTGSFLLASQADLAADLSEGVLISARMVLNQQLQIAAAQIIRVGDRYTRMSNSVASSCQVCADNPVPLWEIRAASVVHDQLRQQLYFDSAQLRVGGVPVFYLPRLRMPDPTLKRATGFLTPELRTTSGLGPGVKVPYFIALGPSRDLTLTPYLTAKSGRTLGLRYRQAFATGQIEVTGAVSTDDMRPDKTRGYVLATGAFDLPRNFKLDFNLQAVSDPAYYLDYAVSDQDRLDNRVEISRTRHNEYISGRVIQFRSIRAGEDNATLPSLIGDFTFHRRFDGGPLGGEGGLRFQTHSHYRTSSNPLDADLDGHADGRDLSRVSLRADWRRNWVLPGGVLGAVMGEVSGDIYAIRQDALYQGQTTRLDGAAAVELRWPWVSTATTGAAYVIEPVLQLVASPRRLAPLPNEDSALVEFDEGNLFSLNRFAGSDARERGVRLNLGIGWTRYDPAGWNLGATLGRVLRRTDPAQFGPASGLAGRSSDWLAATQLSLGSGIKMTNRLLFDDSFAVTKAEVRMDLNRDRYGIGSSYVWMLADAGENRLTDTSELYLDGRYDLTAAWTGKAATRYDLIADRATNASLGLEFRNECLAIDLSLSRRFTSSTSVEPTTDFGLSVDLLGFGSGTKAGPARVCRR